MTVGERISTNFFDIIRTLYGLQEPTAKEGSLWNNVHAIIYEDVNHILWNLPASVDENVIIRHNNIQCWTLLLFEEVASRYFYRKLPSNYIYQHDLGM